MQYKSPMRILFRGRGNKPLGEIDLLAGLAAVAAFAYAIQLIWTGGENICRLAPISAACSPEGSGRPIAIQVILTIISALLFSVAWWRIFRAVFLTILKGLLFWRPIRRLTIRKTEDEIRSFPNKSAEHFRRELEYAKKDEGLIVLARSLGLIRNRTIWRNSWPDIKGRLEVHANLSVNYSERASAYATALERLKHEVGQRDTERIELYVSSVQPGILYCAKEICRELDRNAPLIDNSAITGPGAVHAAYNREVCRKVERDSVLLVAPLSAFLTFSPDDDGPAINELFTPVSCLVREPQDVLVVRGQETSEIRKGTLFVYNNSTAEECLTRLPSAFVAPSGDINIVPIEDFEDYKLLLKGGVNSKGDSLQHGDAIITWPPLTEYYQGRVFRDLYLDLARYEGETADTNSRIMLYAPQAIFDNEEDREATWQFIDCLTYRFFMESGGYGSNVLSSFGIGREAKFYRDHAAKFKEIVA